jgi:flavodoxin
MERTEAMKILVTFYTKFGHTLRVARKIVENFGAETEEIIDKKERRTLVSWFLSAFNEELRTPTEIEKVKNNPADFDLVIVGTPIWDGIAPAVRRYLRKYKNRFKKVAFFITFGASAEDAAYVMETIVKKKPVAVLELQDREILLGADKKINQFCEEIKKKI